VEKQPPGTHMIFLKLKKSYGNGMFRTKERKIVFYVSRFLQKFKELGRTMEIYVHELVQVIGITNIV
jgi:hypothetical protein